MTDLIPPLPPGAEKKQSLLKRIFSKKEVQMTEMPAAPPPTQSELAKIGASLPPILHKDNEINTIRQSLGLQETKVDEPSKAIASNEPAKIQKNNDRLDDITLDLPPQKLDSSLPDPKENGIKDLLDDLKPNYQPHNRLPPIPKLNANAQDYKSIDFTKDIPSQPNKSKENSDLSWDDADLFSTPAKKAVSSRQIESLDKMKSTSSNSIDWTTDVKQQAKPISSTENNSQKNQDLIKELEKKMLEENIEDEIKPTKNDELPEIKPLEQTQNKIEDKNPQTSTDDKFLSQPVQKFADQVRQKIADQVRKEEKQKLLEELKQQQDEEIKKKELETKKILEEEKQKAIAKIKDEKEKELQLKLQDSKKEFDSEREKLLKEAKDELAKAKNEKLAAQKEIDAKRQQLDEERADFEKKKTMLTQKENALAETEKSLSKTKDEIKAQKLQLENDKKDAQELLDKLSKMREEFKDLHSKIDMINQRIKLNEELEKNLEKREAAIEVAQSKFQDLENNIREQGFSKYLDTELNAKQITYPEVKGKISDEYQDEDHSEIYQLIDRCRSLVWQNNIKEARNTYMQARDKYHELQANGKDDEKLYMSIRELYDDINLAVMK